jgi:hypothetical protein
MPPVAQLLQRQYGYPMLRHRQARHVHHRIEEPKWRDHAAEAAAAAAALAAEVEAAESGVPSADAEMLADA